MVPRARACVCGLSTVSQVGSTAEREDQRGIAHYLEHVVFMATEKFTDFKELRELLASWGMSFGGDTNAFTDFRQTCYTLTIPVAAVPDDDDDGDDSSDGSSDGESSDSSDFDSDESDYSDFEADDDDDAATAAAAAERRRHAQHQGHHHHRGHQHQHHHKHQHKHQHQKSHAKSEKELARESAEQSRDETLEKALQVLHELVFKAIVLDTDIDMERGAGTPRAYPRIKSTPSCPQPSD